MGSLEEIMLQITTPTTPKGFCHLEQKTHVCKCVQKNKIQLITPFVIITVKSGKFGKLSKLDENLLSYCFPFKTQFLNSFFRNKTGV